MQKVFLEVDEQGTEAAAATIALAEAGAALTGEPPIFRADHPFLFLVRDVQRDRTLIIGRVERP